MRLVELTLERYGAIAERTLAIPATAGLTVVYGANEAGKSTCLAALGDFLFGIPERTPHASLFGYDGMRLGATFTDSQGMQTTLRRRRGRGRTLSDDAGAPVDEGVLGRLLGATTRERFSTLFGLNHETLRSGGARLLAADGDIGRLIVEAGGGLRSLVARLDAIDAEADRLFAPRRSGERAFYKALDAFDAADRDVKLNTVSRDDYERARKAAGHARTALGDLRGVRQALAIEISVLERLVRVVPHCLELDRATRSLDGFADLNGITDGFETRVAELVGRRDRAAEAHAGARTKRDRLAHRLDLLAVAQPVIEAEAPIRDLGERATRVRRDRADRPDRIGEIETAEAGLATLRRMLHLGADADLAARLPSPQALEHVQDLATDAIERGSAIHAARERAGDLVDRVGALQHRLDAARATGADQPAPFGAAQFAGLPAEAAAAAERRRLFEQESAAVRQSIEAMSFSSVDALTAFSCPPSDIVRAEYAERQSLEREVIALVQRRLDAESRKGIQEEAIQALEAAGTVASDAALVEARGARQTAWTPLRDAWLDGEIPQDGRARRAGIDDYERQRVAADELADRRAAEAQRAANLALARQTLSACAIEVVECGALIADLSGRIEQRAAAFSTAFPEAVARYPELAGLAAFVDRRTEMLEAARSAEATGIEAARLEAALAPAMTLMAHARAVLRLEAGDTADLTMAVQALSTTLGRHEREHRDFVRDKEELGQLRPAASRAEQTLADLIAAEAQWRTLWSAALAALGLDTDLAPERAGTLVSEWSAARTTLAAIEQGRAQLARMDLDETGLASAAAALGARLVLDLPADALAGADLIAARWREQDAIRLQRDALLPDVEDAGLECADLAAAETAATTAVTALALEAGISQEGDALALVAARCAARAALKQEAAALERAVLDLSDGLALDTLRAQWAGRDLDLLRGALVDAQARVGQVETEIEAAILALKAADDTLEGFASETGLNQAIAERESAAARMQATVERYVELSVARDLVAKAIERVRHEQQDPLVRRASALFASTTRGEFEGIETDIDDKGTPVVVGRRASGGAIPVSAMSDGTRDQLYLAFRLASLENYAAAAEPLPFVADDILVHFDDARGAATLDLLALFGAQNQVLLFTHHKSVRDEARRLEDEGLASIVELSRE